MLTPEQEYNSTIAYLTFPGEYEKYCVNASMYVERVMCYAEWLSSQMTSE